jgi:hypothetical protein
VLLNRHDGILTVLVASTTPVEWGHGINSAVAALMKFEALEALEAGTTGDDREWIT